MRRRLAILPALVLGVVAVYGMTGAAATFRAQGTASQGIAVGSFKVVLYSSTPGASITGNTVTCPPLAIAGPSGPGPADIAPACNIQIASTGNIPLSSVTLKMTASSDGAHLDRFAVKPSGLQGSPASLLLDTPANTTVGTVTTFPASIDLPVVWGSAVGPGAADLDTDDMGKSIVVTYTIEAVQ